MSAIFELLSSNLGVVTTIATAIIAISAGVTSWLTWSLVKENRILRKIGEEPKIVAYLSLDEHCIHFINFALVNVGRGPAKNIDYQFCIEERFYGANRVSRTYNYQRKPVGFLPQDEKISMFFGSGVGLLGDDTLPPFQVTVKWENLRGNKFESEYELDVKQFLGFSSVSVSPEKEIADALKKISKRLDNFTSSGASGRLKVETITTGEVRRQQKDFLD